MQVRVLHSRRSEPEFVPLPNQVAHQSSEMFLLPPVSRKDFVSKWKPGWENTSKTQ